MKTKKLIYKDSRIKVTIVYDNLISNVEAKERALDLICEMNKK
jgi:hypothetical protein